MKWRSFKSAYSSCSASQAKFSPISWALLVADPGVGSWSTKPDYTLYVDIIDPSLKYERTLVLQVYVKPDGTLRGVTPLFM